MRPVVVICLLLVPLVLLVPAALAQEPARFVDPVDRPVTLEVREKPLREALALLFKGAGLEYAVDPAVPDPPVTVRVVDVPFRQALKSLLRVAGLQIPGLTYVGEGIYLIKLRSSPAVPSPNEVPPVEEGAVITELRWWKVPLHYADVRAITRLLEGTLVATDAEAPAPAAVWVSRPNGVDDGNWINGKLDVYGLRGDNSLFFRAVEEDAEELKRLIRLLDVPFRQLRVRLSAGPLAAAGVATNGSALQLTDASGSGRLAAVVVPRVNGDGTVSLAINGSLTAGGATHPLATHARVRPGEPARLFTFGAGRRAVVVRVEVAIDAASGSRSPAGTCSLRSASAACWRP